MANLQPPLPLEDILLSPDQGFWPLAPGWWVLIVLSIGVISWGSYLFIKKRQQMAFFREQQKQLDFLEKRFRKNTMPSSELLSTLNRILKLTLVHYSQQKKIAALTGNHLILWLDKYAPIPEKLSPLFNDSIFKKAPEANEKMDKNKLLSMLKECRIYQKQLTHILLQQSGEKA